ncbi:MAG: macro domain-containing protein [Capsulimonadales bacterium]|nr:macro domain-containing protein [Capsulimonadales bacterium]
MPSISQQLPTVLFILALFGVYGALVRQGRIQDRNVLWVGIVVGLLAVGATAYYWYPYYRAGLALPLFLLNPTAMLLCAGFCVYLAYRSQLTEDVAFYTLGDTKVIVRVAPAQRVPDAHALILPTDTSLRMADGIAASFGMVTGGALSGELKKLGPVPEGKVVETSGGKTAVERIFHVAVADNLRPVRPDVLRRGVEAAAAAAGKRGAESLVLPVAVLRGLTLEETAEVMVAGLIKHHKAFAEIVIVILHIRDRNLIADVVRKRLGTEGAIPIGPTGR